MKGVKGMNDKLKALANDIIKRCQEQELTIGEMQMLLTGLQVRLECSRRDAEKELLDKKAEITPF